MFASSTEWLQNKFYMLVWAHTDTIQLFEVEPNWAKESPEAFTIELKQKLGYMALLAALYKMVHPSWKHVCLTPLGVRKHPDAFLVSITGEGVPKPMRQVLSSNQPFERLGSEWKIWSKTCTKWKNFLVNPLRIFALQLSPVIDTPSPNSMTHTANSDGRQNAVDGPLSSSRPPPLCQQQSCVC